MGLMTMTAPSKGCTTINDADIAPTLFPTGAVALLECCSLLWLLVAPLPVSLDASFSRPPLAAVVGSLEAPCYSSVGSRTQLNLVVLKAPHLSSVQPI